jgi:uncharacterized protein
MDYRSVIEEGLKRALKEKNAPRVSVLRMLLAAVKNKEVEKIRTLTDDEFFALVKTSINQHVDSVESFRRGNRPELADKEEAEIVILKEFLPAQLSEAEIISAMEEAVASVDAKNQRDMGKVIKFLMEKFPGRVDGKVLSSMVLKRLSAQ